MRIFFRHCGVAVSNSAPFSNQRRREPKQAIVYQLRGSAAGLIPVDPFYLKTVMEV